MALSEASTKGGHGHEHMQIGFLRPGQPLGVSLILVHVNKHRPTKNDACSCFAITSMSLVYADSCLSMWKDFRQQFGWTGLTMTATVVITQTSRAFD